MPHTRRDRDQIGIERFLVVDLLQLRLYVTDLRPKSLGGPSTWLEAEPATEALHPAQVFMGLLQMLLEGASEFLILRLACHLRKRAKDRLLDIAEHPKLVPVEILQ